MKILVLGGRGFIGSAVVQKLRQRGHDVTVPSSREVNFLDLNESAVKSLCSGHHAVINMVGVMSRHHDILEQIHHIAPVQLAKWAVECGVAHWVQLSALGADAGHVVDFVGSKGRGDSALLSLANQHFSVNVARPSVVFGRGGKSCELFIKMAWLPVLALPSVATGLMQPVDVADVADGLVAMAEQQAESGAVVNFVGTTRHTMGEYLQVLRQSIHGKKGLKIISLPMGLITPFLPLGEVISNGFLSKNSMILLQEGSYADGADFAELLQRTPLGAAEFGQHY